MNSTISLILNLNLFKTIFFADFDLIILGKIVEIIHFWVIGDLNEIFVIVRLIFLVS